VELGAVVVIPQSFPAKISTQLGHSTAGSPIQPLPLWPVVGRNLVQEWVNRIRHSGVDVLSVAPSTTAHGIDAALGLARQGVEQFLVVSVQSYAEIDLLDFVRYHRERRTPATVASNQEGPLGVEILSRTSLTWRQAGSRCEPSESPRTSEYCFQGYAKHLRSAKGYSDLVTDALSGQCELTPRGSQFGADTWVAENARIADSVRFNGPCFVGADTLLCEGVTVGPFSSIEDGCVVECGTMILESTILPQTLVSAGLNIRRSVVDGPQLEHLDSGVVADLFSAGLARRLPMRRVRTHSNPEAGHRGHIWDAQPISTIGDSKTRIAARTACRNHLSCAL
jgi:carbonic anhydrase/acetyltransferase-like protein (isoleucine patch superfamily)